MRKQWKKFTLTELLIVISIIAILAAILLPALNSAREKAVALNCLSNIKQTGAGILNYANDFNGWIPSKPPGISSWVQLLSDNHGVGGRADCVNYIRRTVDICPADPAYKHPLSAAHYNGTFAMWYRLSEHASWMDKAGKIGILSSKDKYYFSVQKTSRSSEFTFLTEARGTDNLDRSFYLFGFAQKLDGGKAAVTYVHRGGTASFYFADGHAALMKNSQARTLPVNIYYYIPYGGNTIRNN